MTKASGTTVRTQLIIPAHCANTFGIILPDRCRIWSSVLSTSAFFARFWRMIALVSCGLFLAACDSELPEFQSAPLPDLTPNLVTEPGAIRVGDRIEVSYYENRQISRGPYRIGPGDVLSFNLVGEPDTQANSILVQQDGFASFPVVGQTRVVGKTMQQLTDELEQKFIDELYSNPLLNMTLVSTYSVSDSDLAALSGGGGSRVFAAAVPEDGRISLPMLGSFNALTSAASLEKAIQSKLSARFGGLYGAAVNIVNRAPRVMFVTGAVNEPGELTISGPMTPVHAIASAGGFVDGAEPRSVAVIRYDAKGTPKSWIVDLKQVLISGGRSKTPLLLQSRDILYVPRKNVVLTNAIIQQYILNNLPFGIGLGYDLNQ